MNMYKVEVHGVGKAGQPLRIWIERFVVLASSKPAALSMARDALKSVVGAYKIEVDELPSCVRVSDLLLRKQIDLAEGTQ